MIGFIGDKSLFTSKELKLKGISVTLLLLLGLTQLAFAGDEDKYKDLTISKDCYSNSVKDLDNLTVGMVKNPNPKCSQSRLLQEGKNLNYVTQKYAEKLSDQVTAALSTDDAQKKSDALAKFKGDGTCFQSESADACMGRLKRSYNNSLINTREENLKYNDAITGMFSKEGQLRQGVVGNSQTNNDLTKNGVLRDLLDTSKQTTDKKSRDQRYIELYQMKDLTFTPPAAGEKFLEPIKPNAEEFLKLSKEKYDFRKENPDYVKENKNGYSPTSVSEGSLTGSRGSQDNKLLEAKEKIRKRDGKGYEDDEKKYKQLSKYQPQDLQQNSTSTETFKKVMNDLDSAVKKADAKDRKIAVDKAQGIKELDRFIKTPDMIDEDQSELLNDAGVTDKDLDNRLKQMKNDY